MRKYQQLVLLLLSLFSITVLLLYKNENNRLKDVLQVVNFFGRSDVQIIEKDLQFKDLQVSELLYPLPVFQAINSDFHIYAAYYWERNELKRNGGEACAQVVGKRDSIVNFRCTLVYNEKDGTRRISGKFHFQRVHESEQEHPNQEYAIYFFFCRTTRNFGLPSSVAFSEMSGSEKKYGARHEIRLRHSKLLEKALTDATEIRQSLTVCLNLIDHDASSSFAKNKSNLLQFFAHHHSLGVEDFLIYASENISPSVFAYLRRFRLRLYLIPFNFPFVRANDTLVLQKIIETDCLIRNTNYAKLTTLLRINEFLYLNKKVESLDPNAAVQYLAHNNRETLYFDLNTISVCLGTARQRQLLVDNTLYNPSVPPSSESLRKPFIYRPHIPASLEGTAQKSSTPLSQSMGFVHRYAECVHIGSDGLAEWRNSVRDDFMSTIMDIRKDLSILFANQTIQN